jgi:hypothetical protein
MTISNRPEPKSGDPAASASADSADSVGENDPERVPGGAWISLGLSLGFYLLMLAIGVKYDSDHRISRKPAEPDHSALASPMAYAPANPPAAAPSPDTLAELLARAHDCAAAAHWNCVIEATSAVIVQHGDTPETRALLAQAMVNGGWLPVQAPASAPPPAPALVPAPPPAVKTHTVHEISSMPTGTRHTTKHVHRQVVRTSTVKYAAAPRAASDSHLADLYRH